MHLTLTLQLALSYIQLTLQPFCGFYSTSNSAANSVNSAVLLYNNLQLSLQLSLYI
jgi:hypothetical protein